MANVRQNGDDFEVLLVPGRIRRTLLRRLVDADTVVTKFDLVEPSLHDIFIEKVRESRMKKFLAVVKREYVQRVRTKFFVIATILGPVLMAGVYDRAGADVWH